MQSTSVALMEESRLGKLRLRQKLVSLRKALNKDEVTEEMIKGGGDRVVDWIWRLYNKAFESGVASEDWRYV